MSEIDKKKKAVEETMAALGENASAEEVLEYSTNPNAPLHPFYEWDDTRAGHQYRLQQTRQFIRLVVTVLPPEQPKPIELRVEQRKYISAPSDDGKRRYRLVTEVAKDPDKVRKIMREFASHLRSLRQKYSSFMELTEFSETYGDTMQVIDNTLALHETREKVPA